jgi:hypothetical protein
LPVGARVGDFDIVSVIHRGEAGFVYLAADRSSSAKVAVKEYLPNRFADRLADGNIGVRSLRYQDAIPQWHAGFSAPGANAGGVSTSRRSQDAAHVAAERQRVHGDALVARRNAAAVFSPFAEAERTLLKTMLGPLLDAIAALHRARCYPCDVTARNVGVDDGGPILSIPAFVRRILARTPRGRPAVLDHGYAALEQYPIDASLTEGPWTDVYAVASVLHVAITGIHRQRPPRASTPATLPPLGRVANGCSTAFLEGIVRGLGRAAAATAAVDRGIPPGARHSLDRVDG